MIDFFRAIHEAPFLRYALIVGLLASVSLGVVGSYVVTRRITYIAAAISHCVLGGIGAAYYLNVAQGLKWCDPLYGAMAAALLSAVIIGMVSLYARQREDTVISAMWAVGMAVGLLFFAKTPGYVGPAMSYLFGDILLISAQDVWLVAVMDVVVVALGLGFYPKLLAVCFDDEFTELRGVKVKLYYLLLLCLTALTVVLLVRVVGIVLVIALLTLPAAVAGHFAQRLWQMMLVAVLCSMLFVTTGLAVSYPLDLPSGPVIILIAGAVYLAVALVTRLWRRH
ncbi:MAG: metal ABC transporter permease [Planctomycetaceae bacterium]|nr:metal ABC transporter permease [Planctomycetaceae bacterium]